MKTFIFSAKALLKLSDEEKLEIIRNSPGGLVYITAEEDGIPTQDEIKKVIKAKMQIMAIQV